jgi:hypothetical protein
MRLHPVLYLWRCKINLFLNVASSEFQPDCDSAVCGHYFNNPTCIFNDLILEPDKYMYLLVKGVNCAYLHVPTS